MDFNFFPNKGINELNFGMTRDEVRHYIGIEFLTKEFYRSKFSKNSTDSFSELGLFVNYESDNKCDSFEFHSNSNVIFNNRNLMDLSYIDFAQFIKYIDENLVEDESGCTSFLLGIGAYAPNKEEFPDEKIESIIGFKRGYYD